MAVVVGPQVLATELRERGREQRSGPHVREDGAAAASRTLLELAAAAASRIHDVHHCVHDVCAPLRVRGLVAQRHQLIQVCPHLEKRAQVKSQRLVSVTAFSSYFSSYFSDVTFFVVRGE